LRRRGALQRADSGQLPRKRRYKAYGCAACIAAGSALSELTRGRPLLDAARVSKADLEAALGGALPEGKGHALTLVLDACTRLSRTTGTELPVRCSSEGYAEAFGGERTATRPSSPR
jgi:hypothetical protein